MFRNKFLFLLFFHLSLLPVTTVSNAQTRAKPQISVPDGASIQKNNFYPQVKLETSMGEIIIELSRSKAPISVNNFLYYVKQKEYDNTLFHRVISDYIVQGGGYDLNFKEKKARFKIINESGNGLKNETYTISMARMNDPHSAKRQFFFNMRDNENLDPGRNWGYTVFGSVTQGYEVLDAIAQAETHIDPETGLPDTPKEDIILLRASILPEPSFE